MKYLRLIRVRKQQKTPVPTEIMATLPKMSRQQFSDAIRTLLGFLGDSWSLKQMGFGHEGIYKLFLRPYSLSIFKTRDSGSLPTWAGSLRSALPLSPKQILSLADSREAYKSELIRKDKAASIMLRRDGVLKAIGLSLKELEKLLDSLEHKILNSKYFVWHDLNSEQTKKYECTYFRLQLMDKECIISIKSRMELSGIWKEARENYNLYLTIDELFVLEALLRNLENKFQTAKWCCQAPTGIDLPGKPLKRYVAKGYTLGYIETPISLLLRILEESRLFSTLTPSPVFVPCQDLKLILQAKNPVEKAFFPALLAEELRTNLSNWCYDSRHLLDLAEIWNVLYPGDWH
ncbi:MAG: hypothetical protein ACE5OZ_10040 [Candidatus Heimdallarchaeota archaeon]